MRRLLVLALFVLFTSTVFGQTLLLQESFEGDASNYDANTFDDGAFDYFTDFNISTPPAGWPRAFSNVDGNSMFGAEDLDDTNNPLTPDINGYIVISSQDISSYDQVQVTLSLGAVYDGGNDVSFEESQPDGIFVQYAFDGNIATAGDANVNTGTYTTVGQFKGNDGDNPTGLYEDTDLNGSGDGTLLTETFQDFSYTFDTNGATSVSIRIKLDNDLSEEIGIDNIRIYGLSSCTEPTIPTVTASPNPVCLGSSSTLTFSGNLNDATRWHVYTGSCGVDEIGSTTLSTMFVVPDSATTYYVRGEGGCVTPGSCGTVTVSTKSVSATITTSDKSSVTGTSATLGGNITYSDCSSVSDRGVVYATSGDPMIGGVGVVQEKNGTGTGSFSETISGLTPNTIYYFKAYAINSAGTTYGEGKSFRTSAIAPSATTNAASSISTDGATLNGTVNANNSSATVTFQYGVTTSYGSEVTAEESPVTGTSSTAVSKSITGLTSGTTYHYRVKAVNTGGTTYGADQTFTTLKMTPVITWENPEDIDYGTALDGTQLNATADVAGSFTYTPNVGTVLEVGFAQTLKADFTPDDTDNYNLVSKEVVISVNPVSPSVTTSSATDITINSAKVGGSITSNGGSEIIAKGVCISETIDPDNTDACLLDSSENDSYVVEFTGLSIATAYHARAFATNSVGTTYGNDISFTTVAQFTLTYSAGTNGSLTGDLEQTVEDGNSGSAVTAVADTDYHFVDWSDGVTDNPRTDSNVTGNISVTANFEEDPIGVCERAEEITAIPYTHDSSTIDRVSTITSYGSDCLEDEYASGDYIYSLDLEAGDRVEIELDPADDFDGVLVVLDSCGEDEACVAAVNDAGTGEIEMIQHEAMDAETLFIVVEGVAGATGDYTLSVKDWVEEADDDMTDVDATEDSDVMDDVDGTEDVDVMDDVDATEDMDNQDDMDEEMDDMDEMDEVDEDVDEGVDEMTDTDEIDDMDSDVVEVNDFDNEVIDTESDFDMIDNYDLNGSGCSCSLVL